MTSHSGSEVTLMLDSPFPLGDARLHDPLRPVMAFLDKQTRVFDGTQQSDQVGEFLRKQTAEPVLRRFYSRVSNLHMRLSEKDVEKILRWRDT
jgi:hypothetical protein